MDFNNIEGIKNNPNARKSAASSTMLLKEVGDSLRLGRKGM